MTTQKADPELVAALQKLQEEGNLCAMPREEERALFARIDKRLNPLHKESDRKQAMSWYKTRDIFLD